MKKSTEQVTERLNYLKAANLGITKAIVIVFWLIIGRKFDSYYGTGAKATIFCIFMAIVNIAVLIWQQSKQAEQFKEKPQKLKRHI
ncbi:MAG: hypothetical protein GX221_08310 [Candidatus Riflebacteria bacterium]|nr:hypothetical protein [Candidatus Riflebacteria bacterium]